MPISDLTGTVWQFNSNISNMVSHSGTWVSYEAQIFIDFKIKNDASDYYEMYEYYYMGGGTSTNNFYIYKKGSNTPLSLKSSLQGKEVTFYSEPVAGSASKSMSVSGFLTWLQNNATLIGYAEKQLLKFNNKKVTKINGKRINSFDKNIIFPPLES